jgi:hypothetical protein
MQQQILIDQFGTSQLRKIVSGKWWLYKIKDTSSLAQSTAKLISDGEKRFDYPISICNPVYFYAPIHFKTRLKESTRPP